LILFSRKALILASQELLGSINPLRNTISVCEKRLLWPKLEAGAAG
jgi:hypothetical protein